MLDAAAARRAVEFAAREFSSWSKIDLNERKRRISECLAGLRENHELLTYLLMWEIGENLWTSPSLTSTGASQASSGTSKTSKPCSAQKAARPGLERCLVELSIIGHSPRCPDPLLCGNTIIAKTPHARSRPSAGSAHRDRRQVDVGLELAQAMRRFGSQVTVIEAETQLAGREDPDVGAALLDLFHDEKIDVLLGATIFQIEGCSGEKIRVHAKDGRGERIIEGTDLLVARRTRQDSEFRGVSARTVRYAGKL